MRASEWVSEREIERHRNCKVPRRAEWVRELQAGGRAAETRQDGVSLISLSFLLVLHDSGNGRIKSAHKGLWMNFKGGKL